MKSKLWLVYAVITTVFWGIWGALIELPEKAGFPSTLIYVVWSLTMIPPALVAMRLIGWKFDFKPKSIFLGMTVGLLGAGGQLILFKTLAISPAYLVYPFISMSPVVTIALSMVLLKERVNAFGWGGVLFALIAIPMLSYSAPSDSGASGLFWILPAFLVFFAWGLQAYVIKVSNTSMEAENIFFYMMLSGLLLAPVAWFMTDFSQPVNWGFSGPGASALIQTLNSVGALFLVYAFRHGKAMIVSPMTNAVAPVITIVLSLIIYSKVPGVITLVGMVLAIAATLLLSIEDDTDAAVKSKE